MEESPIPSVYKKVKKVLDTDLSIEYIIGVLKKGAKMFSRDPGYSLVSGLDKDVAARDVAFALGIPISAIEDIDVYRDRIEYAISGKYASITKRQLKSRINKKYKQAAEKEQTISQYERGVCIG